MWSKILITFVFCFIATTLQAQISRYLIQYEIIANSIQTPNLESEEVYVFLEDNIQAIFYEINLQHYQASMTNYTFQFEIKKHSKEQARLKPLYIRRKKVSDIINLGTDSLEINKFISTSGNYDFIATLFNDSNKVIFIKKNSFQLLRNNKQPIKNEFQETNLEMKENLNISKSFVQKYTIEQLQKNIQSLAPLAKGAENRVIKESAKFMEFEFMKQFFYNFWSNRNANDPEKAWKEYAEKLNFVAKKYGTGTLNGYESDRGRIYLIYGIPDKLEKVVSEKDAFPHEIWFYYLANGRNNVKFLFAQPGLMNTEMFMLQSNQEDEMINPMWWQQLYINPENAENKLEHRAYEFFNK